MKHFCQLLILICLFAFSSCKNKTDYSKEISRLDSASAILSATEKNLLAVDTTSLRTILNSSSENLHSVSVKLSKDTVKKKIALFLSDAYEQSGNILNLLDNQKYIQRAIKESQQRISDLKHDLTEDLIEKNKSMVYVVNEVNTSGKISATLQKAIENAKSSSQKLDSMKTQIAFLADSLKSK